MRNPQRHNLRRPHDAPAYGIAEAARILRIPPATLRSWVVGRPYTTENGQVFSAPPIRLPDPDTRALSFLNVVEAHNLLALRVEHGVPLGAVRRAIDYAEKELEIERLLIDRDLRTSAGQLFLDRYGELVNLSRSGQLAMRKLFEAHLKRIDWNRDRLPIRLYPLTGQPETDTSKTVSMNPSISFGRPVIHKAGVSTAAIVDRIDAGESARSIAKDYGITTNDVEIAVLFEKAA